MQIRDVMTRDVKLTHPGDSCRQAALLMKQCDCGVLPVADGDRLVGMITDRDIAIRCIGEGKGADCKVSDCMTQEVKYCFEDEGVDQVSRNMADIQVRRLPVLGRDKRLVGVVSIGDLARREPDSAKALHGIAQPSAQHNQARIAA